MIKFDTHVATQGHPDPRLEAEFAALGFKPDPLIERHVTFDEGIAMSACPLIGSHLTKKYDELEIGQAKRAVREDLATAGHLLERHGAVGYAHSEITVPARDVTIRSEGPLHISRPWPIERFDARPSERDKKWDIHIAIPHASLEPALAEALDIERTGLYYIDLMKRRDGREQPFRIFTIQGTCPVAEGQKLFDTMVAWFREIGAPHVEVKQETYLGMVRVGKAEIVPPTISEVRYPPQHA